MSPYEEQLESIKHVAIGCTVNEIMQEAEKGGWSVRVVKENGKNCMGTCDFQPFRINVAVDRGEVTEIVSLG